MSEPSNATTETTGTPLAFRVVRGGLWVAASSYFNIAVGFAANLALTRILLPEDFGTFALASFFFAFLNLRTKVPLGLGFAQRPQTTGALVGTHFRLDVAGGLLTMVLAAISAPILSALGYPREVVLVMVSMAGVAVMDSVTGTAAALLEKELHFGRTSLVTSVAVPVSYALALWLAAQGAGYWSLVAQNAAYALLIMAGMWWVARRRLPEIWQLRWTFDRDVAKFLVRFGSTVGFATLAGLLVGQFDNFLVGTIVGITTLGFYNQAYRMAQWPTLLITGVVTKTAFYTYARLQDDAVRLGKTVTMTFWLITTLGLPMAIGVFAAAPDLITLLYGERWLPSALFLRLLIVYAVVQPFLGDAGMLFVAMGRPRISATVAAVQAATLVVAGTFLTWRFGAIGTCVAVGLAFMIGLALTYRYLVRQVAVRVRDTLGWPALAAAVTVVAYFGLVHVVDVNEWPLLLRVTGKLAFSAAVYFAAILAIERGRTFQRFGYLWRLVRQTS